MQLTKKLEAEIQGKYLAYWDAYLKGDMKTFAAFLSDDLSVYGTAEGEVFKNKKQVVAFYAATADQLTGQADFRNRRISLKAIGNTIVVNEQCDLYVLAGKEWMFYGHVRLTAIFEQKGSTWKLVHQHGSFPDSRTEDGEQIATKKVKAENLKLKEAVKRRTTELQAKNKELQIESALERVRTVAMAMKKADDMLDICKAISQQLAKLGVKEIRNVQTAIFYPQRGTYMNYEYYAKHNKTFITDVEYKNHKIQVAFARKMMKGANEKVVEHLNGEKLKNWYNYQKTTNQFADKYILTAHSLSYYWYSLGPVALGISTYAPLNKDELDLFQRFMKVFELAYRRYLDIEQAAAQAREAQIEAALERIRARALAMHSSDELTDVAKVLREQMGALGQRELETSAVHLYDEDAEFILSWRAFRLSSDLEGKITYGFFKIPKNSCKIAREFMQKFKSKAADYTIEISGARQTEWYKILFKLAPEVQAAMKKSNTTKEKRYYHFSKFSGGSLLMVSSQEPSNDAIELQKRAAQVFDLAYRRFKDLQKAEVQAREAQIEAALERIRAASLAMQDSSALGEIIYKLYGELTKLDAKLDRCFIMIVNPGNKGITWWMAGHEGLLAENGFFVQMNQHPSHLMYLDYCKKRKKKWTYLFEGKEKRDWDRFGFSKTELAKLPEPIKDFMAAAKKVHLSGSSDQFGSLVTGSFEPLPEEQQEIISRFAIAFNQAYVRFLDLQKAEAQAKEAQIQLALERVRARTMAMQNSNELPEAANLLFQQAQSLGMPAWSAGYCTWNDDEKKSVTLWMSSEGVLQPPFEAPTTKDELFIQMRKGAEEDKSLHVVEMGGKNLVKHYQYMRTLPVVGEILDSIIEAGHPLPTFQIMHQAYFSKGFLLFITYEPVPAVHDTFKRFANVFDQTYTRFLDLQRAEAQAREAQVEAALERVRSRSMAMHKSEELADLSLELVKQVQALGVATWFCAFNIYDDDANSSIEWGSNGQGVFSKYRTPREGVFLQYYKAGKRGETLHVHEIAEDKCAAHYEYLCSLPGVGDQLLQMKVAGIPFPKYQIDHVAFFKQGYLLFITYEPVPEAHDIFKRFARVFEQSYTRFLDLKNAEAQAREAEIQLALERVRARSLAMHHTDELQEVVNVVAQQLLQMGIDMDGGIFIAINDEVNYDLPFWAAAGATDYVQKVAIPFFNRPIYTQLCNAIKKRDPFITEYYTKAEKNEFLKHMFRHHPWNQNSAERKAELLAREGGYARSVAVNQHTTIGITNHHGKKFSDADNTILQRFGAVLEQSYTRFLDLQKAEAQAREAKIESALERVRSRSLAMHHSSELSAVVDTLLTEFTNLEFALTFCIINLIDEQDRSNTVWAANPETGKAPESYYMKFEDYPFHHAMWDAWKAQKKNFIYTIEGKEKKIYDEYLYTKTEFRRFPKHVQEANKALKRYVAGFTFFKYSGLQTVSENHITNEDLNILERFGRVFEQCYTRFLDLQKAEAQAREAQIEASLEKVRSRSMAMQQPEELVEVAELLRKEMGQLGVEELETSSIYIVERETKQAECWYAIKDVREEDTRLVSDEMHLALTDTWVGKQMWKFYQSGEERTSILMKGERRREWINYCAQRSKVLQGYYGDEIPDRTYHLVKFSGGYIGAAAPGDISAESWDLLKRVSTVFSLAYTRFKDLQDAAARAREAQIELALERVRSRSMAMHKSEELKEVIRLVLDQFIHLNINAEHAGFYIDYKEHDDMHIWLADPNIEPYFAVLPYFDTPTWNSFLESKAKGIAFHTDLLDFKEKNKFYKSLFKLFEIPEEAKRFYLTCKGLAVSTVLLDNVGLYIENFQGIPYSEEENKILMRFGKVFQQTYTRFLDLQKAEAQAREAQIEAALERVRSRSMAMHDSKELGEVAKVMFNQMKLLGGELFAFGIVLCDKDESIVQQWHGLGEGDMMTPFQVPVDLDYIHRYRYDQWKAGVELFSIEIPSDYIARHFELMFALPSVKMVMDDLQSKGIELAHPSWEIDYGASFRYGYLLVSSLQPYAEEKIFPRFAKVFEQAYTRFLDLQKAEAQAREAQIEAALERVRSKAMAMHNSSDLPSTAIIAFSELKKLGFVPIRGGISIQNKENRKNLLYSATSSAEGDNLSLVGWAMLDNHPVLAEIYNQWMKGEDYFPELRGDLLKSYYEQVRNSFAVPLEQTEVEQYGYFMYFTHGVFYGWCANPVLDDDKKLLRRFAAVIDLTFKRYFDLQKSEAQAREAQIEAALEKVRSRTLAMQKSDELAGTAAVLFQQLISLGIEPNRLYIILIKDNNADMEAWVTDEDGSKVSMGFTGNYQKNGTLLKMYEGWRAKRKTLVIDMQGEELQQYFHYLHDELKVPFKGGMEQKRRVQHIAYFSHGLIGMASPEEQPIETLELLERFAYVFNLTFTRFNDLQVAEAHALQAEQDLIAIKEAKQKAEQALTELQATQKQLIQSEKMASLGELTAGIAHEIQNPLNFVNNFSEVSKELLEEMREAIEKGDNAEAREIMEDVIRNLEKINHHGKRADGIVKGMLQHSRSSSGQKEMTDINDLCDEYLRLAYHGLRAKDKSFNAHFETKLDPEIGWVEIVPQEIGRVILNLINNAFYAVNARRKTEASGYVPTVQVVTTKQQDKIEIRVADNGTGIPASVKEKIFQPFFTTKPTGEGTGLGLSLSYDIVKAHGGKLSVETKEGEGTVFIIQLPSA